MMKTALSIIQKVMYRSNLPAPASIYNSTDPGTLQLYELLINTLEELRQAKCFSVSKRKYSFSTSSGRSQYQLPPDFYSPIMETLYNQSEYGKLFLISDARMGEALYGSASSSVNYVARFFGFDENTATGRGQFEINPTPSSTQTLGMEYISRNLFLPKHWAASTVYGAGVYVNVSGNIYYTSAGGTSSTTAPTATSGSITDGTVTWTYYSSPYETILADTDLVIFDDDIVKLGLRAKYIEEKGGDYALARDEFQRKLDIAKARFPTSQIGSMADSRQIATYRLPSRSWSF